MIGLYQFQQFVQFSECLHGVSMKDTTVPFSFSLALHTGEYEALIVENRKLITETFETDVSLHFVVANQTHSDHIHVVTKEETRGWESLESAIADCDALITDRKGVMLGVLTADCVPVLLYDPVRQVVAAVHAGWRGTQKLIVAKTVKRMEEDFGCNSANIYAGIAPAIGKCCYEVGEDVAKHFFYVKEGYEQKGERYMLDLPFINRAQLLDAGVKDMHIEMSGICTACEVDRFFSYRKEEGCTGRFMSLIGIAPSP